MAAASSGPDAGTVTFTGTRSRTAAGHPRSAASRAARHQAATRPVVVVPEGRELAPAGVAVDEDTLADGEAAEPAAQGDRVDGHGATTPILADVPTD